MCPFGPRIKDDTHSWDQNEDVARSVFRLSSRVCLCLALSQPSLPPHASAACCNVTSHKHFPQAQLTSDSRLYPSTSASTLSPTTRPAASPPESTKSDLKENSLSAA
ncbi:hypothetical protein WMY93_021394 [Mugilogobius chulae]|uniref:Uncharacterized protein n=1 Tax=Mugilogobius chulae TaxID=88201 RepID=A0AAW0NF66_9GOBI